MKFREFAFEKGYNTSWDEIFQSPCPITVSSFKTGTVWINKKGTINPNHPQGRNVVDEQLEVPILSHWVHHEKKGDFLLDTGLDISYFDDSRGGLEGTSIDEFNQGKDENIVQYISKFNLDIQMVFLSHLHADHAAGVRELPKDIPYVIAKGEYDEYHPEIHGDFLKGLDELYEIDFKKAREIPPLGPSVDLLGDGSLWAILTPGHTPAHVSFLINGNEGPILLTMDAAFIKDNLKLGAAPSDYTWNVTVAQESLEKIIEFLDEYPQVKVGPGHELLKEF